VQVGRGRRIRIGPAGTFTLEQAKDRAKRILIDPEAATKVQRNGETLAEYIEGTYAAYAKARLKNGEASVARIKSSWKPLLGKRMSDIRAPEIDRLRTKRLGEGIAAATVNRDAAALSGLFAHWVANTKGATNPLADLAPLDVADDEIVRYLSAEEERRLRQALADRDARIAKERKSANEWRAQRGQEPMPEISGFGDYLTPMVLFSINTGMRQGETFSMQWEHVDIKHKTISVIASNSKGNKTRTIPLNAEALAVLNAIKPDTAKGLVFRSPKTGERFDNVKKSWAEVAKAAELPDLRWHDLRHHFASTLVMRGVALFVVQRLLGHASPATTQRYARLAPSTLADAVGVLDNR
jgi:integrase